MKSWKTTLAGVITAGTAISLAMGWISPQVAAAIGGLAVSLGLVSAKDSNVTGGTKQQ